MTLEFESTTNISIENCAANNTLKHARKRKVNSLQNLR